MDKLGGDVNPLDVADGASKGMHAVSSGVRFQSAGTEVMFGTPDTPLVRWDAPLPFPTPIFRQPVNKW